VGLLAIVLLGTFVSWYISPPSKIKIVPVPFPTALRPSPPPSALVERLIKELQSGGLSSWEEDEIIGRGNELKMSDQVILVQHEPTEQYLEKIINFLWERSLLARSDQKSKVRLHEDRYLGKADVKITDNGTIFFGASFLLRAQNEAEVAGILAHEIGHVVLRHYAQRRRTMQNGARLENEFVRSGQVENVSALMMAKELLWGNLFMAETLEMKYQEEADRRGLEIMHQVQYDYSALFNALHSRADLDLRRIAKINAFTRELDKSKTRGELFLVAIPKEFRSIQDNFKNYLDKKK
jgi:Zn-dependent peptidase ImmA (M78 family)